METQRTSLECILGEVGVVTFFGRLGDQHAARGADGNGAPRSGSRGAPSLLAARCRLLLRMKNQLLHAPVQYFGDVDLVFGWACHFVNPTKLFELLARLPEYAQDLPVQTQFVYPARISVPTSDLLYFDETDGP